MNFWTGPCSIEINNGQMGPLDIKSFHTAKDIITQVKRQPTEWKRIFNSYTSERGLMSRICKELKQPTPIYIFIPKLEHETKQRVFKRFTANGQDFFLMFNIFSHEGNAN